MATLAWKGPNRIRDHLSFRLMKDFQILIWAPTYTVTTSPTTIGFFNWQKIILWLLISAKESKQENKGSRNKRDKRHFKKKKNSPSMLGDPTIRRWELIPIWFNNFRNQHTRGYISLVFLMCQSRDPFSYTEFCFGCTWHFPMYTTDGHSYLTTCPWLYCTQKKKQQQELFITFYNLFMWWLKDSNHQILLWHIQAQAYSGGSHIVCLIMQSRTFTKQ